MINLPKPGHESAVEYATLTFGQTILDQADSDVKRDRDGGRLQEMVKKHYDFIWRSLRRLGLRDADVDDAAQGVFLTASRKLEAIRLGSERPFLFQTALRVAADARRSRRRRREVMGSSVPEPADHAPGSDELVDLRRARDHLEEILDSMALELRVVFVLFELDGLTMANIAEIVELPPGTVASRLRRARAIFCSMAKRFGSDTLRGGRP